MVRTRLQTVFDFLASSRKGQIDLILSKKSKSRRIVDGRRREEGEEPDADSRGGGVKATVHF